MKRTNFTLLIFSFFSISLFSQVPVTIALESFATGFDAAVDITNAGDDRLFIIEQDGLVKILRPDGSTDATPFLNMTSLTNGGGERGLLGLSFHPDYDDNGYFFVNYTMNNGNTRISRFTVSDDPDVADFNSREDIITISQPQSNHNGGCLKFGPDGYLYIGMGDGGGGGDPNNYSQNINSLLGKMLRLDVDNGLPYTIPADNPFVGEAPLDEIWAIGVRNPWRFSFDSQTGDLWIADVGQSNLEEINLQLGSSPGGENYGWRCYEGTDTYNTSNCAAQGNYDFPVAEYDHDDGCSITGGFVYRGVENLDMQGKYFCVDYCSSKFWSLEQNDADEWLFEEEIVGGGFGWRSFGVNEAEELFVSGPGGVIYKVIDADCIGFEPSITVSGTTLTASAGQFYQWYLDDDIIEGETASVLEATTDGTYTVSVQTADGCFKFTEAVVIGNPNTCPADFDNNEVVDVSDFLTFNSMFGQSCQGCPQDFDQSGEVDVADFLIFNSQFGDCE